MRLSKRVGSRWQNGDCRASKYPDLAGDLPIFDKKRKSPDLPIWNENLPIYYKIQSRLALSIASFAIAVGETSFSLAGHRGPTCHVEH